MNTMRRTRIATALQRAAALTLLLMASPSGFARETCTTLSIFDVYDQLLPPGVLRPGEVESVTLRYIPGDTSIEREVEVRIATTGSNETTVEVLEPRERSIHAQFATFRSSLGDACEETALKRVVVDRRELPSNVGVAIRRELMRKRIDIKLRADLYLDTPRYDVWVKTPMNEMSWVLYGPDGRNDVHPLIAWAKAALRSLHTASGRPK